MPALPDDDLRDLEVCLAWMSDIPERRIEPEPDAIIALGNAGCVQTAQLTARLYHEAVSRGSRPVVVVSGFRGRSTEHFPTTEAQVMAGVIQVSRVPDTAVFIESRSTRTQLNFLHSFGLLDLYGERRSQVQVVHCGGTARRNRNLIRKQFAEYAEDDGHRISFWDWGVTFAEILEARMFGTPQECADMVVGTLNRTVEHVRDPFPHHLEDPPPAEVLEAYLRLRARHPKEVINAPDPR